MNEKMNILPCIKQDNLRMDLEIILHFPSISLPYEIKILQISFHMKHNFSALLLMTTVHVSVV